MTSKKERSKLVTVRIIYASGHTRTFRNRTQKEANNIINTISFHQSIMPLDWVKVIVS